MRESYSQRPSQVRGRSIYSERTASRELGGILQRTPNLLIEQSAHFGRVWQIYGACH
jgi:hypothetical protein